MMRRAVPSGDLVAIVHRGKKPGPSVVLTANLHGDEVVGVDVLRRVDRLLRETPFHGTVALYPSCNPLGLAAGTRRVPADDLDLNRCFPAAGRSTFTHRLADVLWRDISSREPDVVIDVHSDSPQSVPYAIIDRPARRGRVDRDALAAKLIPLAQASGWTVLREYEQDVYLQFSLDRSLAGAVVNHLGLPAVTLEVGPRRYVDPASSHEALLAIRRMLMHVGCLAAEPVSPPSVAAVPGPWRRSSAPRTRRPGMLDVLVPPGSTFRKGELLARVFSFSGELNDEIRAPEPGVVVSWVESGWIPAGGVVGTLGVLDGERL